MAYAEVIDPPEIGDAELGLAPNDLRSNAKVIEEVPYADSVNNTLATPDDEGTYCVGYGSVWYSFTSSADLHLEANTYGSDFDTILAIYDPSSSDAEECNDDYNGLQSRIRFSLSAGEEVLFKVAGYTGLFGPSFGNVVFNLIVPSETPENPGPVNDDRSDAAVISTLPYTDELDNSSATVEPDEATACGLNRTVWYSFTASEDIFLTARVVTDYGYGPGISVYGSDDPDQPIACTDAYYQEARLRFTAFAGRTYYLQAGQTGSDGGQMTFSLSGPTDVEPPPAAGDNVEDATLITALPFAHTANTEGLSLSEGEAVPCGFIGSTTWYRFVASEDGPVDIFTKGSWFDTVAAVYEASSPATAITCNDDLDARAAGTRFIASAGIEYLIQIGGRMGQQGQLQVTVDNAFTAPPDTPWGSHETSVIRPGASIGNCTANFIFRGRGIRAGRIYLGTAAHCVDQSVGENIYLYDDDPLLGSVLFHEPIGHVAYSSWKELNVFSEECYVILSCSVDDEFNDFALIEIDPSFHQYVHPAMRHFGGPSSLARFDDVNVGEKIVSFGNSGLRPGPEELDWHEGYVTGKAGQMEVDITMTPGIFGDSGSPVIMADGRALGVLVTLLGSELGTNGVSALQPALDFAAFTGGWDLELGTWSIINRGLLP